MKETLDRAEMWLCIGGGVLAAVNLALAITAGNGGAIFGWLAALGFAISSALKNLMLREMAEVQR